MVFTKQKIIVAVVCVLAVLIAGSFYYIEQKKNLKIQAVYSEKSLETNKEANMEENLEENSKTEVQDANEESAAAEDNKAVMKIYMIGAVVNPGVYEINEDMRLIDALELAGGLTEDADIERINQAKRMSDEEVIRVPKIGEELNEPLQPAQDNSGKASDIKSDGKININSATIDELKTLSGVGDVLAKNIVDYREKNGGFKTVEEIKKVNRIGDKIFELIKNDIKIQ